MTKRFAKTCMVLLAGGSMLGIWSCIGPYVTAMAASAGYDFLADNDAIFDLFQDDFGTGTTYDDRNSGDPSRSEP